MVSIWAHPVSWFNDARNKKMPIPLENLIYHRVFDKLFLGMKIRILIQPIGKNKRNTCSEC